MGLFLYTVLSALVCSSLPFRLFLPSRGVPCLAEKSKPAKSKHSWLVGWLFLFCFYLFLKLLFTMSGKKAMQNSQQNVFLVEQCLLLLVGHPFIHVPKGILFFRQCDHLTAWNPAIYWSSALISSCFVWLISVSSNVISYLSSGQSVYFCM